MATKLRFYFKLRTQSNTLHGGIKDRQVAGPSGEGIGRLKGPALVAFRRFGPQPFLLTPERCEWFNFGMGPLSNVLAVAVFALILTPLSSARGESGNPLRGALTDPVGVLAPRVRMTKEELPPLFNAQRGDYSFKPTENGVLPIAGEVLPEDPSFQRAVADWEHFRPAKLPVREGTIFLGDPRLLLASVADRSTRTPAPDLHISRPVQLMAVGILAMLSLGWIYLRVRGRRSSSETTR